MRTAGKLLKHRTTTHEKRPLPPTFPSPPLLIKEKADAANYDDWNELFCDPLRLAETLRLEDGTRLFELPHRQRFGALHRVNWRRALAANVVKTHREAP